MKIGSERGDRVYKKRKRSKWVEPHLIISSPPLGDYRVAAKIGGQGGARSPHKARNGMETVVAM
jgi:hypothetical protein